MLVGHSASQHPTNQPTELQSVLPSFCWSSVHYNSFCLYCPPSAGPLSTTTVSVCTALLLLVFCPLQQFLSVLPSFCWSSVHYNSFCLYCPPSAGPLSTTTVSVCLYCPPSAGLLSTTTVSVCTALLLLVLCPLQQFLSVCTALLLLVFCPLQQFLSVLPSFCWSSVHYNSFCLYCPPSAGPLSTTTVSFSHIFAM